MISSQFSSRSIITLLHCNIGSWTSSSTCIFSCNCCSFNCTISTSIIICRLSCASSSLFASRFSLQFYSRTNRCRCTVICFLCCAYCCTSLTSGSTSSWFLTSNRCCGTLRCRVSCTNWCSRRIQLLDIILDCPDSRLIISNSSMSWISSRISILWCFDLLLCSI